MTDRVQLRWGGATDVGQLRSVNQDSMLVGPDLFVVADGMGGHQGGEVASALAIDSVAGQALGPSITDLITAVQDANETVYARGTQDPSLSGMGTTFVALAVVEDDGEPLVAIVNVGDSRAYRLSDGVLEQITDDHSLVAELVREGRISEQEAAVHPQRNIVTRALGIDPTIPVDDFEILPHRGDRYLLCSDGLTNEVTEPDIAVVLRSIDDPEQAAQELVRQANEHGGRDNITIVIVDVVDDGGASARASALVPDHDDFSDSEHDTESFVALPDDRAHEQNAHGRHEDPTAPPVAYDEPDEPDDLDDRLDELRDERGPAAKPQRAITLRSVAFVLVVVALLGAGAYLVNDYARNTYHVIIDDSGEVAVYRGRPGGVLWFDPSLVETTGIDEADVPAALHDDLTHGVSRPTLASAERYVTNLEDRIAELTPPVTTTTTTTTTTTPLGAGTTGPASTSSTP